MLKSRHLGKYVLAVLAAAFLFTGVPGFATPIPIPIGEQIVNGGFQTGGGTPSIASWTTGGTANARLATNTINTSGGNAGFKGFFTSPFAVLGDTSGAIGSTPTSGISSISQQFTLPATNGGTPIDFYDITISFRTVFNGQDSADTSAIKDSFSAGLFSSSIGGLGLFIQSSAPFPSNAPSTSSLNSQLVNNPFSEVIFGLPPDTYTLSFNLNETGGTGTNLTNTAAGIDDVTVTGTANPLAVPEPGTLVLLGAGLLSLSLFRKNRKNS